MNQKNILILKIKILRSTIMNYLNNQIWLGHTTHLY